MTFQSSSLRKYGLSLALLLLIVLAAVLSLFVLSTHNTPAHADGTYVDDTFVLKVDLTQSGDGRVFLISTVNPSTNIQISVDDQVSATFPKDTIAGSIPVKVLTHTIIGRYIASDGTVVESEPTYIQVDDRGEITFTNH